MEFRIKCRITAYCPNSCCNSAVIRKNGKHIIEDWTNRVAAGDMLISDLHSAGIDIAAVDPRLIPFGSIISFGGRNYIALDAGSAIKGNRIDISMKTHAAANDFGLKNNQEITVFVPREPHAVIRRVKETAGPGD